MDDRNLLSVNPNLLSFADRIYNRYRDLYDEKTLYGKKGLFSFSFFQISGSQPFLVRVSPAEKIKFALVSCEKAFCDIFIENLSIILKLMKIWRSHQVW